jgi:hypothetical protein
MSAQALIYPTTTLEVMNSRLGAWASTEAPL